MASVKIAVYSSGLIAFALVIAATLAPSKAQEKSTSNPAYVSSKQCKLCHNKPGEGQQFAVWQKAPHAGAFKTLLGDDALAVAKKIGLTTPPSESADCLKCHVTGYNVETKTLPPKLKLEDGVQCDSCHGPGSNHLADGKKLRMDKDADIDIMANLIPPDANTCVICHNEESPTWNPERYTLESGEKTGFHFDEMVKAISHKNPTKSQSE